MKLLVISTEFPPGPGGIGAHAQELSSALLARGWQLEVVTPQDYVTADEARRFRAALPYGVVPLPALEPRPLRWMARAGVLLREWLMRGRADAVLATGDPAVFVTAPLARLLGVPWVAIEHGNTPTSALGRALKRAAFEGADAVVSVSAFTERRLREQGIVPRRSRVIHNGADGERFGAAEVGRVAAFRGRFPPGAMLLLTVGHVTRRKGQDVVVRTLPTLVAQGLDVHYALVGKPSEGPDIDALARSLGVGDRVHVLGQLGRDEIPVAYAACDLFVMTSRPVPHEFEGFGIAAVEAALCGKAAVVSRESGLVEAIADGVTGLGVPPEDVAATADALGALLADAGGRRRMGEAARTRARAEQTWERRAAEYDELLRDVVARRSGRA